MPLPRILLLLFGAVAITDFPDGRDAEKWG